MNNKNDLIIRFDKAWKQGAKKVGVEFFNLKASSINDAHKRWQLEPNYRLIKDTLGGYSHSKQPQPLERQFV